MVYAFDFFNTLDTHPELRVLARNLYAAGNEIHIVSAVSPGLPIDNDEWYATQLRALAVPFTKIHRTNHDPQQKVAVLKAIGARAFWDDSIANVIAARRACIPTMYVGVDWLFVGPTLMPVPGENT